MSNAVDSSLWMIAPAHGVAGGPLVHSLTAKGLALAFTIGSRIRQGAPSDAILLLASKGGRGALSRRNGARLTPTDLGKFDQLTWLYLKGRGLIETPDPESVSLTEDGTCAIACGRQEQDRLLARVRAAHPISEGCP